ncbi:hypothetical protein OG289_47785 [Streptomyces sp. NBC_01235]|nr:hypothetical protein OG289_47785 [Streptomyces sp. NBC_01235]
MAADGTPAPACGSPSRRLGLAQINAWLADLPSRWTVSHDVRHGPDPVRPSPDTKRIIRDFAGAVLHPALLVRALNSGQAIQGIDADLLIPIGGPGQRTARYWSNDSLQWVAYLLIAFGWVLTSAVIAGVTRALQKN